MRYGKTGLFLNNYIHTIQGCLLWFYPLADLGEGPGAPPIHPHPTPIH